MPVGSTSGDAEAVEEGVVVSVPETDGAAGVPLALTVGDGEAATVRDAVLVALVVGDGVAPRDSVAVALAVGEGEGSTQAVRMSSPAAPTPDGVGAPPTYATLPLSVAFIVAFRKDEPPPPPLGRLTEP